MLVFRGFEKKKKVVYLFWILYASRRTFQRVYDLVRPVALTAIQTLRKYPARRYSFISVHCAGLKYISGWPTIENPTLQCVRITDVLLSNLSKYVNGMRMMYKNNTSRSFVIRRNEPRRETFEFIVSKPYNIQSNIYYSTKPEHRYYWKKISKRCTPRTAILNAIQ